MLKIGKIQVNKSISPNIFLVLVLFSFVLFAFFSAVFIVTTIKTKNYIPISAVITNVSYEFIGEELDSTYSYVDLKYEYNDKNYENKQRVAFRFNKKIGNNVKIFINPSNPSEVRDNYIYNLNIIISIISLIIHLFMIKLYVIRRKSK